MGIKDVIETIRTTASFADNITAWRVIPHQPAHFIGIPDWLHPILRDRLNQNGVQELYSHQFDAITNVRNGRNIVITTGTASGKSLCYQIPIINSLLSDASSTALLIFPTKALTHDQMEGFNQLIPDFTGTKDRPTVFDGDTPQRDRQAIRERSRIVLTNPDMLNIGILPNHTRWARFFENLRFVVIDEIHVYRGVFGSHVSNLIRRLKRIASFYGAYPQFILTSATIQNPKELSERLIESAVDLISEDGSPHGEKNFIVYNPPLVNQELGIREGLLTTTQKFLHLFQMNDVQSLVFCRTRKFMEILLRDTRVLLGGRNHKIMGYRSGYLKAERRQIEQGLKNREILFAIATNALELGVDIGGVESVLIPGFPGTIAAMTQQSGRAGRKENTSLSIFIASMNPLDQYLAINPEYLLTKNPEVALINPDNPLILLEHLQCTTAELPMSEDERFGNLDSSIVKEYMEYLVGTGVIHKTTGKYYWVSDDYPAQHVAIRNAINSTILIQAIFGEEIVTIGEVDFNSGLWMVHPGAVYIHNGDSYLVESLDLEKRIATLSPASVDYTTDAVQSVDIEVLNEHEVSISEKFTLRIGELIVRSHVEGFKRIKNDTREVLDFCDLDLPETQLRTVGYWVEFSDDCVNSMISSGSWKAFSNDYGKNWEKVRLKVRLRDGYRCQVCGVRETLNEHHVHHKIPFKMFSSIDLANALDNLITLCPNCHKLAENQVRVRSAISGLKYVFQNLSPLIVMCDPSDLGSYADPAAKFAQNKPAILFYDAIPAGVGLSELLFKKFTELLLKSRDLIEHCECTDGCPSCVGPTLTDFVGGKHETLTLINELLIR